MNPLLADIVSSPSKGTFQVFALIAAIIFGIDAIITILQVKVPANIKGALITAALCVFAIGFLWL